MTRRKEDAEQRRVVLILPLLEHYLSDFTCIARGSLLQEILRDLYHASGFEAFDIIRCISLDPSPLKVA